MTESLKNKLTIVKNPTKDEINFIYKNLIDYNVNHANPIPDLHFEEFTIVLKNDNDQVVGGLLARIECITLELIYYGYMMSIVEMD